ncbi:hypothetical protein BJ912DRAFT_1054020 [Pholiota molesta]|nr:hypothetical protein BJ912DRAFT_1054020 [Pholiota molesta]
MSKAAVDALKGATYIVLRGLPKSATSGDLHRAILQADVKGVSEVALQYRHFRPTGKAILTMALPDFTRKAILQLENTRLLGVRPEAEPILSPETFLGTPQNVNSLEVTGDGPSAGVTPRELCPFLDCLAEQESRLSINWCKASNWSRKKVSRPYK